MEFSQHDWFPSHALNPKIFEKWQYSLAIIKDYALHELVSTTVSFLHGTLEWTKMLKSNVINLNESVLGPGHNVIYTLSYI